MEGNNFLADESLTNDLEMHDLSIELPGTKTEQNCRPPKLRFCAAYPRRISPQSCH
jgi:hypothetical protein